MKKLFGLFIALLFVPAISNAQLTVTGGLASFGGDAFKEPSDVASGTEDAFKVSTGFNAGLKYKYSLPIPIFSLDIVGHFNYAVASTKEVNIVGVVFPKTDYTAIVYGVGVQVNPIPIPLPIFDPYVSLDYTLNSVKAKNEGSLVGGTRVGSFDESKSGSGIGIGIGTGIKVPLLPINFDAEVKYRDLGNKQSLIIANVGLTLPF